MIFEFLIKEEAINCQNKKRPENSDMKNSKSAAHTSSNHLAKYGDVQINSREYFAYFCKGLNLCTFGKYDEAIECYDKSIQISLTITSATIKLALTF